jgi:hypothetical protein
MNKECLVCGAILIPNKFVPHKKFCSKKCGRHYFHYKNLEAQRLKAKDWYFNHRESEIEKNKEYRKQNKELFNWYHDKNRFDGFKNNILKIKS